MPAYTSVKSFSCHENSGACEATLGEVAGDVQVLRNTFINSRRAAARRLAPEALADDFELADPRDGSRPDHLAETREVFAVIAGLSERSRDALVAVDVAGLSYGEAAELLGTSEANITSRLFRARAEVARKMESPVASVQADTG